MALSENEKSFRKASDAILKDYKDVSEQLDELKKVDELKKSAEIVGMYPNPARDVCPGCGRCRHCGHQADHPHYPQYPYNPYLPPITITWDSTSTSTTSSGNYNTTMSNIAN